MNVLLSLSPVLRRNLCILFVAGLLFWASLTALLPTLPLYIESIGGDSQAIGIVMGTFAIGLLTSRAWLARLADSQGRKIVLLIGMSTVAVAPLGYLATKSILLLMVVRAFHGLSIAAFALAYSALVIDLSPPQHRGEVVGYMSLVNPIGMALGPAMGGFLMEWVGYTPMFLAATGIGVLGLFCTTQVREPQIEAIQRHSDMPQQFWRMLASSRIRIPAMVLLLIGLAFGTLSTFVPLLMQENNVALNVGLFYTSTAIASFSIRLIVGRASDYYGRGPFITISLILYTLAMSVLWQATSAEMFLIGGVLEGAGAGILIPMMAVLMADRSAPDERGRTFSLAMVGFDLGIAIAGPILGTVAKFTGYQLIFGLSAGLSFLAILIFLTLSSKNLAYSLRFAVGRAQDVYAVDATYKQSV